MAIGKKTGGGSRKGKPNKDVAPIREKLNQLLDGYTIEMMLNDLKSIKQPEERLRIFQGLAEYAIPKLARTEVKTEDSEIVIRVVRE